MDLTQFFINYHIGEESQSEHAFCSDLLKQIHTKYPYLKGNLDIVFNNHNKDYSAREREEVTYRIVKSVFKDIITKQGVEDISKLDMQHVLKTLKRELSESLSFYLDNCETFFSKRGYASEPVVVYSYHILTEIQSEITKKEIKGIETEEDKLVLFTFNNVLRSIKSSFVLFAMGDDVHGIAIIRGAIELLARLTLMNDENIKDALYFSHINSLLQNYRSTKTMDPELKEFLEKNKLTKSSAEMFLLNGWAKDKNGKPITDNRTLFRYAFKDGFENINQLYHTCSEFVHEDYTLVNYDFIYLREYFKTYLASLLTSFEDTCKSIGIKVKGWKLSERSLES